MNVKIAVISASPPCPRYKKIEEDSKIARFFIVKQKKETTTILNYASDCYE